ncbi:MAG TPA: phBC6A51 family helix-turn-helix protein [Pyrinomonadaceae bacterium]|nr:phBC6A51 family helix-turn-helix protein [Pyrinomonadaceae bacterium]
MSTSYVSDYTRHQQQKIVWDKTRSRAASLLALGYNKQYVADDVGVCRATIYNWLDDPEFCLEVDRLSVMLDVSSRAERMRHVMRVIRSLMDENGVLCTEKDPLDWLKYAQSETDGAKIDLSKLAELLTGEHSVQVGESEQRQLSPAIDVSATSGSSEELSAQGEVVDEDALNPS